jgi:hypothetical protein
MGYLRHFAVTHEKENKNTMSARTGITLTRILLRILENKTVDKPPGII